MLSGPKTSKALVSSLLQRNSLVSKMLNILRLAQARRLTAELEASEKRGKLDEYNSPESGICVDTLTLRRTHSAVVKKPRLLDEMCCYFENDESAPAPA